MYYCRVTKCVKECTYAIYVKYHGAGQSVQVRWASNILKMEEQIERKCDGVGVYAIQM